MLAKGFGKVVPDYAAVAAELAARGILPPETAAKLRLMARYRNRMVHFYDDVTPPELYGILTGERGDVEEVLAALQRWLAAHPRPAPTSCSSRLSAPSCSEKRRTSIGNSVVKNPACREPEPPRRRPPRPKRKKRPSSPPQGWRTTDEDEIERRRQRAAGEPLAVEALEPGHPVFGTFRVSSETGSSYEVEIRSLSERDNSCGCPDYEVNGLGTCKHVEAVLARVRTSRQAKTPSAGSRSSSGAPANGRR